MRQPVCTRASARAHANARAHARRADHAHPTGQQIEDLLVPDGRDRVEYPVDDDDCVARADLQAKYVPVLHRGVDARTGDDLQDLGRGDRGAAVDMHGRLCPRVHDAAAAGRPL